MLNENNINENEKLICEKYSSKIEIGANKVFDFDNNEEVTCKKPTSYSLNDMLNENNMKENEK